MSPECVDKALLAGRTVKKVQVSAIKEGSLGGLLEKYDRSTVVMNSVAGGSDKSKAWLRPANWYNPSGYVLCGKSKT